MEEPEIPTEHLHETIHEHAQEKKETWALLVALSTAFIAVLAAIAGLLSGHHVNEALIDQIKASDQWAFYQSKSIKSEIASSTDKILAAIPNATITADSKASIERYNTEKEEIKTKAVEHEKNSEIHLTKHVTLSKAVTIFQIAIALSAIAILTKKKMLWYGAMLLCMWGIGYLIMGLR